MESVNLARGTRDFLADQADARRAVMNLLRQVFERHGFEALETPALERIETLTGKYGEEGQRLIFRILKRGEGSDRGEVDMALRYDLTVPLARVVAMNAALAKPYKRWQMAPVWRADRPAKGRLREFWQCDVDVVGSADLLADAECLAVAADAFGSLGFKQYTVRLNDRRLLRAMARRCGVGEDREGSLLVAIDKLDKIGRDGVTGELAERGFTTDEIAAVWQVLELRGSNAEVLAGLRRELAGQSDLEQGLADLEQLVTLAEALGVPGGVIRVDPTLARGLDYYTGGVWEIEVDEPKIGTLAAGGRYDGLIGMFAKQPIPAVGISFGLERLLTVMEELGMLPAREPRTDVLVVVFDAEHRVAAAKTAAALRAAGLRADLYAGVPKLKHQFKYADEHGIPWVAIVGPDEVKNETVALKNLRTKEQATFSLEQAVSRLRAPLASADPPS
jgi:histidyl-tRNA synthetase